MNAEAAGAPPPDPFGRDLMKHAGNEDLLRPNMLAEPPGMVGDALQGLGSNCVRFAFEPRCSISQVLPASDKSNRP